MLTTPWRCPGGVQGWGLCAHLQLAHVIQHVLFKSQLYFQSMVGNPCMRRANLSYTWFGSTVYFSSSVEVTVTTLKSQREVKKFTKWKFFFIETWGQREKKGRCRRQDIVLRRYSSPNLWNLWMCCVIFQGRIRSQMDLSCSSDDLAMKDCPGLPGWAQCNHKSPYKWKRGRKVRSRVPRCEKDWTDHC